MYKFLVGVMIGMTLIVAAQRIGDRDGDARIIAAFERQCEKAHPRKGGDIAYSCRFERKLK